MASPESRLQSSPRSTSGAAEVQGLDFETTASTSKQGRVCQCQGARLQVRSYPSKPPLGISCTKSQIQLFGAKEVVGFVNKHPPFGSAPKALAKVMQAQQLELVN